MFHQFVEVLMFGCHGCCQDNTDQRTIFYSFLIIVCPCSLSLFFSLSPGSAEVNAVSHAQLWEALASSSLDKCCAVWRPDDWEVWESVGWCIGVWLMMIGVNTVARQLAHLLASLCCSPLGEESGLSSTSPAARLDAHEEFNMALRCRPNVPESWICCLEYILHCGIRCIYNVTCHPAYVLWGSRTTCQEITGIRFWFRFELPPAEIPLIAADFSLSIHNTQQNKIKHNMTNNTVNYLGNEAHMNSRVGQ